MKREPMSKSDKLWVAVAVYAFVVGLFLGLGWVR